MPVLSVVEVVPDGLYPRRTPSLVIDRASDPVAEPTFPLPHGLAAKVAADPGRGVEGRLDAECPSPPARPGLATRSRGKSIVVASGARR